MSVPRALVPPGYVEDGRLGPDEERRREFERQFALLVEGHCVRCEGELERVEVWDGERFGHCPLCHLLMRAITADVFGKGPEPVLQVLGGYFPVDVRVRPSAPTRRVWIQR